MQTNFTTEIKTVALIGKYQTPNIIGSLCALAKFLHERGIEVIIEESQWSQKCSGKCTIGSFDDICHKADVAIVIGGDGTMLSCARKLAPFNVPLTGIHQGRLGFMTDTLHENMLPAMQDLLDGKFITDSRFLLEASVIRNGEQTFHSLALNDVVLRKGDDIKLIEMQVAIDDELTHVLRADGVIVATPTGSTAYALSANGPILHPSVHGVALVPLCPHGLTNRPITLSDQVIVTFTLLPPHSAIVHCDGHNHFAVMPNDNIRITRSSHTVTLLHPPGYSYFSMLSEKLHWSTASAFVKI